MLLNRLTTEDSLDVIPPRIMMVQDNTGRYYGMKLDADAPTSHGCAFCRIINPP